MLNLTFGQAENLNCNVDKAADAYMDTLRRAQAHYSAIIEILEYIGVNHSMSVYSHAVNTLAHGDDPDSVAGELRGIDFEIETWSHELVPEGPLGLILIKHGANTPDGLMAVSNSVNQYLQEVRAALEAAQRGDNRG